MFGVRWGEAVLGGRIFAVAMGCGFSRGLVDIFIYVTLLVACLPLSTVATNTTAPLGNIDGIASAPAIGN